MFRFPEETAVSSKLIQQIQLEMTLLNRFWALIDLCQQKFDEYLELPWGLINSNEMEEEVKKLRKRVIEFREIDKRSNVY